MELDRNVFPIILLIFAVVLIAIKILKARNEYRAKEEFWSCVYKFSGCFQPLADAVAQKDLKVTRKLLASWNRRSKGTLYLHKFYCSVTELPGSDRELEAAARWLEKVEEWGMRHEKKGTLFAVTPEAEALFFFDDGYEPGDSAVVMVPCWYYVQDGTKRCIEKGIARIEE